jgi:hypothetical protein
MRISQGVGRPGPQLEWSVSVNWPTTTHYFHELEIEPKNNFLKTTEEAKAKYKPDLINARNVHPFL